MSDVTTLRRRLKAAKSRLLYWSGRLAASNRARRANPAQRSRAVLDSQRERAADDVAVIQAQILKLEASA